MKTNQKLVTLIFACFFFLQNFSQESIDMSLKLTYNNAAVCGHQVLIKSGDVTLGNGTTNEQGEVKFSGVILNVKAIDVFGVKKSADGEKKWDLKGYVTLDENFHAHLKMENYVNEMVKSSGMPAGLYESAWGLNINCDGSINGATMGDKSTK